MSTIRRAVPLAAFCAAAATAPAGVVELGAARDNTLYETPDGSQSNGAGQHCFVGITGEPLARRTLIAFDVQSAIPPGATILQCSLTMHMSKTIAGPTDVTLHRALVHWGEGASDASGEEGVGDDSAPGDATWVHTEYDTYYWASPGGDFDPSPSAATSVDGMGPYSWGPDGQIVGDVQAWLDGALANHGWLIAGDETMAITAKRFDTREHPDESVRPVLRIVYAPECVPDWNSDGIVDSRDVLSFLNEWVAREVSADINGDDVVNTTDVLAFLNWWRVGGCP